MKRLNVVLDELMQQFVEGRVPKSIWVQTSAPLKQRTFLGNDRSREYEFELPNLSDEKPYDIFIGIQFADGALIDVIHFSQQEEPVKAKEGPKQES